MKMCRFLSSFMWDVTSRKMLEKQITNAIKESDKPNKIIFSVQIVDNGVLADGKYTRNILRYS